MDARLSDQALHAIKIIVSLIRREELQGCDRNACSEEELSALEQHFRQLPSNDLLAVIRRHRLESFLHKNWLTARLMPELAEAIRFNAHQQTIVALTEISLIREISVLFEQAGIAILVFKGIALSLQTTGLISSRGSGDVDVLVNPNQLVTAVELLETAGFRRAPGWFPQSLESLKGLYSRWASKELLMTRKGPAGIEQLDLHWSLSNVRGPLPGFEEAWERRETLQTQGYRIATLCRVHAFEHACFHAAMDRWNSLRHLIDIDRLASLLPDSSLAALFGAAAVRCSCAVTFDLTGSQRLLIAARGSAERREALLLARNSMRTRSAVQQALLSQAVATSREAIPWSLRECWRDVWRQATLSPDWGDWLRVVCLNVLWPGAFSDPATGQDRGWRGMIQSRVTRLVQRLRRS